MNEAIEVMKHSKSLLEVTEQTLARVNAEKESILVLKECELNAARIKLEVAVIEAGKSTGGVSEEKINELKAKIGRLQDELIASQLEAGKMKQLYLVLTPCCSRP
jgi:hypothetical protein